VALALILWFAPPLYSNQVEISGDILNTQRNLAALTAMLLMAGIAVTASMSAVAAGSTYVCVSKTTSVVYFKAKCAKTERRVAFTSAATLPAAAHNGIDGKDGLTGPSGPSGATGPVGPVGSSANLPFFQRLESGLTCDEKWRTVTTSVYANNQVGVDRQQALAGCTQPDWAKQYFQFAETNPITLVSTTYGSPVVSNQQTRINNVLVDNPYAPKKTTVSFSAVVEVHPPTGWALCTNTDPQITFMGETGYPKVTLDGADGSTSFSVVNNRATVTGSISTANPAQLSTSFYDLWLSAQVCGPDATTPSGLGISVVSADLFLPAVNR
jgi:hypothetical protein